MRSALFLACCLALHAVEPDPDEVIKRVTERVTATTARIPNYTCVESVVRDFYWPPAAIPPEPCPVIMEERRHPIPDIAPNLAVTDRWHLDVTMTRTGEIFSWAGARRFSDAPINQLVDGPISAGAFGGFLSIIFKQDVQKFTFKGNTDLNGRSLMEYSFDVPPEHSSYKVKYSGSLVSSGYSGTVVVDPNTDDVVHLTVDTNELPVMNTCQISTNLDLNRVKIGDSEFLLPARVRQRYVTTTGEEIENTTTFAQCREYSGTSSVSFGEPEPSIARSRQIAAPAPLRVPASQRFTFELTAPIASLTAAAGDVFFGRLLTPLRAERRKKPIPAGSLVEGRLLRVERHHVAPAFTIIVLQVQRVDVADSEFAMTAVRDRSRELARPRKGRVRVEIPLPLPSEKNAGVFRFDGDQAVVPRGFRADWRTADAGPPSTVATGTGGASRP